MFRDSRVRDREVTASSFKTAFDQYVAKSESWFDGSVGSIDKRLSAIDRLTHSARVTVSRLSTSDAQPYLRATDHLASDRKAIDGLREAMLNGAADYRTAHWADEALAAGHQFPSHMDPKNYSSFGEYNNAVNMSGYLGEQTQKHPPAGWDAQANDYAVKPSSQSSGGAPGETPRTTGYPQSYKPLHPYKPRSQQYPEGPAVKSLQSLGSTDRRWVTLEAAKFVQANLDAADDSHELAERASNHAAVKTSTFDGRRSASVTKAFVQQVVSLGRQAYRPPVIRQAAAGDVGADEALWL